MNLNAFFTKTITILLLGSMMLLASCEKSETDEHSETSGAKGTCTLLPPTVTIEPFGAGTATSRSGKVSPEEQICSITDKMVNTLTVENISEEDTPEDTLKTRALTDGVYYRLVVYKQSEWGAGMAIAEQRLCKIGDTHYYNVDGTINDAPIKVSVGDYKVFCYSFNNTTPIALLPANSANVAVSNGQDFMSAVADVTLGAGQIDSNVSIPTISLTHRCCKLTGTLTAQDFVNNQILAGSPTPSLSVVGSLYSSGTWTIASESLSGTGSPTNTTVSMDLAANVDNTKYSGSAFILPVSDQILSATYTFKPTSAPNEASATKALSTVAKSYQGGTHVSFTIKAVGVYELTLPGPANIGGVKWAAKNLNGQTKSLESQPWIGGLWDGVSVPSVSGTVSNDSKNDYWRWNVLNVDLDRFYSDLPPSNGTTWESSKDPCRQGLGGTWRVPTKENMQSLAGATLSNKWVKINNEEPKKTDGNGWIGANGTRASGAVFANTHSNVVFLPAAGNRFGSSYASVGTYGYYWSSTLNESNTDDAYFLRVNSNGCNVTSYRRYSGYSLRCVQ